KFGGFYGVKQLNVMEEPITEQDMLDDAAAYAKEAFDPRTGLEIDRSEYHYAIADARSISFDADKPYYYLNRSSIKKVISPHDANNMRQAVLALVHYGYSGDNGQL